MHDRVMSMATASPLSALPIHDGLFVMSSKEL